MLVERAARLKAIALLQNSNKEPGITAGSVKLCAGGVVFNLSFSLLQSRPLSQTNSQEASKHTPVPA
jgi:hypothetical protein